ncbi:DeoR/GlpR transcriptional regulator [Edaphobacter sp. 4G125]|nr:DeoR/GlpR transcriptional regulator [Edaphobacter sp. 4G125]
MVIDMARGKEKQVQRHEQILSRLQEVGEITIEELCAELGASVVTIRRDLDELEQRSLLKRTRGGAMPIGPLFYEPFKKDPSFQDKIGSFAEEKRRIARRASEMITPGTTVALTGGTTTTEIIRCLNTVSGITIVTNTVNVAMELSSRKDIDVYVTGGHLRGNWFTLVGPLATTSAELLFADIMFLGVDGLEVHHGLTCSHPQEAEVLRLLAGHSKHLVVVADSSKIGSVSKWLLCPTREIHEIITDTGAKDEAIAPFEAIGIKVHRV